jgi:hypothetical protein
VLGHKGRVGVLAHDVYDGVKPDEIRRALVPGAQWMMQEEWKSPCSKLCLRNPSCSQDVPSRDSAVKNLRVWLEMVSVEGMEPSTD